MPGPLHSRLSRRRGRPSGGRAHSSLQPSTSWLLGQEVHPFRRVPLCLWLTSRLQAGNCQFSMTDSISRPVLDCSLVTRPLRLAKICVVAGIKPNVSAFGADQFDESDPQVSRLPTHMLSACLQTCHNPTQLRDLKSACIRLRQLCASVQACNFFGQQISARQLSAAVSNSSACSEPGCA